MRRSPSPELFLLYPEGLGMDLDRFKQIELLQRPRYTEILHQACGEMGWGGGTAISTIFVEGPAMTATSSAKTMHPLAPPPLEKHPLVVHYGLDIKYLSTKAHRGARDTESVPGDASRLRRSGPARSVVHA